MKTKYYMAYGSNLNVVQMQYRCPQAKIVGVSEIPNYELLFKGSKTGSYLTIEPKENSIVPVAVWEVNKKDEFTLDRYEGYPNFYYKKEMVLPIKEIDSDKEREQEVFVYIMHEDRPLGIPSSYYIKTCLEGYRDFGFDKKFLINAIKRSK